MSRVLVFCSSSDKVSPLFFSEMEALGRELGLRGHSLVYGGAQVGLMGCVAEAFLQTGASVTGVIPEYLDKPGIAHERLTEKVVVSDLLDRKKKMLSLSDIVIAAPGGVGTIDEITEVIALRQLNEHNKPILFFNCLNFWTPFLEFLEILRHQEMIQQSLPELDVGICETRSDILAAIGEALQ